MTETAQTYHTLPAVRVRSAPARAAADLEQAAARLRDLIGSLPFQPDTAQLDRLEQRLDSAWLALRNLTAALGPAISYRPPDPVPTPSCQTPHVIAIVRGEDLP